MKVITPLVHERVRTVGDREVLYRNMVIDGKFFWDQVPLNKFNVTHCPICGKWSTLLEEWRTTDQELLYMLTKCVVHGVQVYTPEIYYRRYPHLRRFNV